MLINRQMAINDVKAHDNGLWTTTVHDDAVTCKDCTWWTNKYNLKLGQGKCILFDIYPKGNDHCRMGERKENEMSDYHEDYCYECTGYGDDYYWDSDSGELVSACTECPYAERRGDE